MYNTEGWSKCATKYGEINPVEAQMFLHVFNMFDSLIEVV